MKTYIVTFDMEVDYSSADDISVEDINDLVRKLNSGALNEPDTRFHSATAKVKVASCVGEVDVSATDEQNAIDQVIAETSSRAGQGYCKNFKAAEKP